MKHILTVDLDWANTAEKQLEIISLMTKYFLTKVPVYFIKQHHQAFELIDEGSIIYNIDHHHDLFYNKKHYENAIEGKLLEANWVFGAIMQKNVKDYVWVKNFNSDIQQTIIEPYIRHMNTFKVLNNLKDLNMPKTDKLIICESNCYMGAGCWLYELLKNLTKDLKKNSIQMELQNELGYIYTKNKV